MRFKLALFTVLSLTATAVSAQYQRLSGSEQELREYTRAYAKCMVIFNHVEARNLILRNTPNDRMERDFGSIYTSKPLALVPGCRELVLRNGYALVLQPDMFRAYLAEELVVADLKAPQTDNFVNRAALTHWAVPAQPNFAAIATDPAKRAALEKAYAEEFGRVWLSHYGECVVRGNSRSSFGLLVSMPGTSAEKAALSELKPALSGCLVQGETLTFGKVVLRGAIAVNYYRLAHATPVATSGEPQ